MIKTTIIKALCCVLLFCCGCNTQTIRVVQAHQKIKITQNSKYLGTFRVNSIHWGDSFIKIWPIDDKGRYTGEEIWINVNGLVIDIENIPMQHLVEKQ